mmetsp:Transcript_5400/g.13868  ORF Transcript_5400/g.13868 Transcript_5400/m.13868 type:complete len:248 (-) Transcript_5400:27-770(-)
MRSSSGALRKMTTKRARRPASPATPARWPRSPRRLRRRVVLPSRRRLARLRSQSTTTSALDSLNCSSGDRNRTCQRPRTSSSETAERRRTGHGGPFRRRSRGVLNPIRARKSPSRPRPSSCAGRRPSGAKSSSSSLNSSRPPAISPRSCRPSTTAASYTSSSSGRLYPRRPIGSGSSARNSTASSDAGSKVPASRGSPRGPSSSPWPGRTEVVVRHGEFCLLRCDRRRLPRFLDGVRLSAGRLRPHG